MGKDEHKTGSNQASSMPQTPKKQLIQPKNLHEETASEFTEPTKHYDRGQSKKNRNTNK